MATEREKTPERLESDVETLTLTEAVLLYPEIPGGEGGMPNPERLVESDTWIEIRDVERHAESDLVFAYIDVHPGATP